MLRERGIGHETYQINMFGGMALQNYKQQVATVPYNERKTILCTLIIYDRRKEPQQERKEREANKTCLPSIII